jgi:glycine betaine/proline transport system substrate-binding protein
MKRMKTAKRVVAASMALGVGLTLAACGSDDGDGGDASGGGASGDITIGIIPSWTDYKSMGYLYKNLLEDQGYNVEIQEIQDNAPLYAGLAKGDIDMMASSWPEVTQASYWEQYSEDIEDLDVWYDNAKLTMAVPEYTEIDSIEELADNPDMFNGQITGIEAGAGLTEVVKDSVMPEYGLDSDYELVTSSTTAMLAELKKATDAEEDILVTLWRPFWANTAFPVKDLEDPKGALGESEGLHTLGRTGFADEFPEAAEMIGNVSLDDEQYGTLEDLVANEYPDDPEQAVQAWLDENPDWADSLQE